MSATAKARAGRYSCGEETSQRVVDAAIECFGRLGYAGTSTRDIAAAAAVNTPAIQYYFGGKLGLYEACVDRLSASVSCGITPALEACQAVLAGDPALAEVIAALGAVQDALIDSCFSDRDGHAIRRLLAWEDAEHGVPATEPLMKDRIGRPIFDTFRKAVECVVAKHSEPIEIQIHALSLMGLSMIFHFNQSRVMDMLDRPSVDEGLLPILKAVAHQQLAFALTGLARPAG